MQHSSGGGVGKSATGRAGVVAAMQQIRTQSQSPLVSVSSSPPMQQLQQQHLSARPLGMVEQSTTISGSGGSFYVLTSGVGNGAVESAEISKHGGKLATSFSDQQHQKQSPQQASVYGSGMQGQTPQQQQQNRTTKVFSVL